MPQIRHSDEQMNTGEAGYMLVAVIVMVALVLIALSVAVPVVTKDLRRQKELESQQRAQQYVRAIRLFYRKTHSYPPSIDALKQTNNVRFLRQEYVDPLTGKADWRLIHLGEQKTTIKGFFGQELGGLAAGGLGSAAGNASGVGSPIGGTSSTSTISGASPLAGGFEGASTTSTTPGTGGLTGGSGIAGSTGSGGSIGGGVIVGVGTSATGNSISTPNKQTTYETWEFWYDPRIEQMYQKGKNNGGIGSTGLGTGLGTGTGSAFGSGTGLGSASGLSSFGTGSFGPSGATGSTGATGTTGTSGSTGPVAPK